MAESIEKEVSIMFADVCGSTKLYEQIGDQRALEVINTCVSIMKKAVAEHKGRVVKLIGDEVMAVYPTPADACNACIQMQTDITNLDPKDCHDVVLAIRVGFHHGKVLENTDDGDVFGDAVNIANQIAGLAKAGRILTSEQVRNILPKSQLLISTSVQDKSDDGFLFFDTLSLKGKSEPINVFKVVWNEHDTEEEAPVQAKVSYVELVYAGNTYKVDSDRTKLTIGRAGDNDIVLALSSASRNHARVEYRNGAFVLVDKSTNGTVLFDSDGKKIVIIGDEFALTGEGKFTAAKGEAFPESMISFKVVNS